MKRLLFLCQTLPFPPDGGSKIRTYNVLKQLSDDFEIHLLAFFRRKKAFHRQDVDAAIEGLRPIATAEAFPIAQEGSRWRWIGDHVRSVLARRVYTASTFRSVPLRSRLRNLLATNSFDAVHLDSLDLAVYRPEMEDLPVTCTHHDAQSLLLARRAKMQRNPFARIYMTHQASLMEQEERTWCPRMDCNLTVSAEDARVLQRIAPTARFKVIPNGVDVDYFQPSQNPSTGIVFVGGTSWYPNRDALQYYCDVIRPSLDRLGVEDLTKWVGRIRKEERRDYGSDPKMELTGYVPDVRPYLAEAACYVVPLRVGGGTRIKILDAWAMGKAIVSTSIGAEGLDAVDGENILLRDDPAEFAKAIKRVLDDKPLRHRLGKNARETAVKKYSWDRIGKELRSIYHELIRSHQGV